MSKKKKRKNKIRVGVNGHVRWRGATTSLPVTDVEKECQFGSWGGGAPPRVHICPTNFPKVPPSTNPISSPLIPPPLIHSLLL